MYSRIILGVISFILLSACSETSRETTNTPPPENNPPSENGNNNGESTELQIPVNFAVSRSDGALTFTWSYVDPVDEFRLYYATEPDLDPDNIGSYENGNWLNNVTSPHTISELDNHVYYYAVLTAAQGDQESEPSNELGVAPAPLPDVTYRPRNDTGVDWCADQNQVNLVCPVAGYPGQDGDTGRDALARSGQLDKQGAGAGGFDFTKLDAEGLPLPAEAEQWSCVLDNLTGLIWEVKTDDGGLRDKDNRYSWYDPNPATNGGVAGRQDLGQCTGSDCDTHSFVQAVNAEELCGANDWRLPTIDELSDILLLGGHTPAIDSSYFPISTETQYWSATSAVDNGQSARIVSFIAGHVGDNNKSHQIPVKLVRGERGPVIPQFELHSNGTATDSRTGLMWKRCAEGQTYDDAEGICWETSGEFTWQEALQRAQEVNLSGGYAGFEDWRVPTLKELLSVGDKAAHWSALNARVFPNSPGRSWSSTPVVIDEGQDHAELVLLGESSHGIALKTSTSPVYLVRDLP